MSLLNNEPEQEVTPPTQQPPVQPAPPSAETKKTEQQEHMIPKGRLDEVLGRLQTAEQERDALKEAEKKRQESEMTEAEKLRAENEKKDAELKSLRTEKMRGDAAKKVGLDLTYADRLKGETAAELEADAKAFLDSLPKAEKKIVLKGAAPESAVPKGQTEQEFRDDVFGKPSDIFSPDAAQLAGGGVFISGQVITREEKQEEEK